MDKEEMKRCLVEAEHDMRNAISTLDDAIEYLSDAGEEQDAELLQEDLNGIGEIHARIRKKIEGLRENGPC